MIAELLNINLVKELSLDSLPPKEKNELVSKMSEVVESRINIEVLSLLSEKEKKDLDKILDSEGDMIQFLRDTIPNFDMLVAETVANFKKEILEMQPVVVAK